MNQALFFGLGLLCGWGIAPVTAVISAGLLKNDRGDVIGDPPTIAGVSVLLTVLCQIAISFMMRRSRYRFGFYFGLCVSLIIILLAWQMALEYKPRRAGPAGW